jgi:hypothetical protein
VTSPGTEHHGHAPPLGQLDLRFGSNAVRLGRRAWLVTGLALAAVFLLAPPVWEWLEPLPPADDARLPYRLSNDYWQFSRYARRATDAGQTLVLGDSVVWGEYVTTDRTLTHYLNRAAGGERFANLGLDGAYPAALAGLVEHYGGAIRDRDVLLHCNLLWMASPRHDLRGRKEPQFNHPALLPQFLGTVPGYAEDSSRRIGIVAARRTPLLQWAEHLKLAYFGGQDVPHWAMDHPYANPLAELRPGPTEDADAPRHDPAPWTERGIEPQDFPWMDLDESLQWRFFRRTLELLRERGNRVTVFVGPFNEHLLAPDSRAAYGRLRDQAQAWLAENGTPCYVPPLLPSALYADASHPLAAGYERLAGQVLEHLPGALRPRR